MKKIYLLIPLLTLGTLSTVSCTGSRNNNSRVTFGTYVDQEAIEIKYSDFALKIARSENFLIATYEDTGLPCGCWTAFHEILNQYVQEYNTRIYYIGRSQFSEDDEKYGLTILNEGTNPTLAFMVDDKKSNEYIYGNDNKPMFETLDGLRSAITRIARDPQYYYVDQDYLDNALFVTKESRVAIQYVWSFCPDCNDCFPYVMYPYSEENDFRTNVWIIDLAVDGLLLENGTYVGTSNPSYVEFMGKHSLSKEGNSKFGYDRGFVPTIQLWEKGVLKDANVYFNDTVELIDNEYVVTSSYYSASRVKNLKYTDTVLEGMKIGEEDVEITSSGFAWKKDSARVYHKPILESFLDTYIKK